jgi:cytochrome c biogenesis protein CcmG/thiol:disulfide interchange protein DsbE
MSPKTGNRVFVIGFIIVLCLAGTLSAQKSMVGVAAPDWKLKALDGQEVKLADFRGKVVILDFWATWCPPCRKEIPAFIELQQQYEKSGLVIVGISFDKAVETVKEFARTEKINYPIAMGTMELAQAYGGINSIPTTFVVDPAGKIVKSFVGFHPKAEFEKEITPLLSRVKSNSK